MIDLASPYWMIRQFGFDSFEDVASAASNSTWKKKMTKWMTDFINYAETHYGDRIEDSERNRIHDAWIGLNKDAYPVFGTTCNFAHAMQVTQVFPINITCLG